LDDEETKMDIDDNADLKLAGAVQATPATSEADEAAQRNTLRHSSSRRS